MAENTSVDWNVVRAAAGHYAGYGRTAANWTDGTNGTEDQVSLVQHCIDVGYRMFLNPPKVNDQFGMHAWRFLRKKTTLTTVVDDYDYALPSDFGGMAESLTFPAGTMFPRPVHASEEDIRRLRQRSTQSGTPQFYAIRPSDQGGASAGQRWEIILYPAPDTIWIMEYAYDVHAPVLASGNPYPLGGSHLAQLFMEAVLAAVESHILNVAGGPHHQIFLQLLPGAIERDRMMGPTHLGQMVPSDPGIRDRDGRRRSGNTLYNGVLYEG